MNTFDQICNLCPQDQKYSSDAVMNLLYGAFIYEPHIKVNTDDITKMQKTLLSQMSDSIDEIFFATDTIIKRIDGWEAHCKNLSNEEKLESIQEFIQQILQMNYASANLVIRLFSSNQRKITVKLMSYHNDNPFVLAEASDRTNSTLAIATINSLLIASGLK